MQIRHSILVISYAQEDLIADCLDSILNQSVSPYEVIVIDDCSPDRTWEVIESYALNNPVIKVHRNRHNLGVFGNFNKIIKLATGDFVNIVAGDDLLPSGILEKYNEFIAAKQLDCNTPFQVFTNSLVLKPDGSRIFKNNQVNFQKNMFEICVFHCFWSWDTGISIGLLRKMDGIREDLGYQADLLWHIDKVINSSDNLFLNEVGYIYRANVGVSVATKYKEHLQSKRKVVSEIFRKYPEYVTPKIQKYLEFDDLWIAYNARPSFRTYCSFLLGYLHNMPFRKNSIHRNPCKVLLPIWLKNIILRIIR